MDTIYQILGWTFLGAICFGYGYLIVDYIRLRKKSKENDEAFAIIRASNERARKNIQEINDWLDEREAKGIS